MEEWRDKHVLDFFLLQSLAKRIHQVHFILLNKNMVPKKVFFTRGVGIHKDKLASFELALRKAGIEKCNLVYVSSIFPPECKIISKEE